MNRDELIERMVKALKPYLPRSGVNAKLAAESVLAAHESYLAECGLVVVPKEPTDEMVRALQTEARFRLIGEESNDDYHRRAIAASIAASQRKGE